MSYVYMKALETAPERYDNGINWLGWGKLHSIRTHIADLIESEGKKILEIGVGTGTQAILLAERGHDIIGIDHSSGMLSIAQKKIDAKREEGGEGLKIASRIALQNKAAVELDEFPSNSFDVVTSTLVFSELQESEQIYVLAHMHRILKPGGTLILADEVMPSKRLKRLAHAIISAPLRFITFLITQTSTKAIHNFDKKIQDAGFKILKIENYQMDSFQLIHAKKPNEIEETQSSLRFENLPSPSGGFGSALWQIITRMNAHETEIGLIPVNNPTPNSPVLCTCNFKLTVNRLFNLIEKKKISAWILVAPTGGINVWCASCGDNFNAGSVITAIKISSIDKYVAHRKIILPQLSASGIDLKKIKKLTGWQGVWGPVQMEEIPDFLDNFPDSIHNKTEKQRAVRFNLKFRLEMGSAFALLVLLILTVPLFLILYFSNRWIWTIPILTTFTFYIYFIFLFWPILPSHWGTRKVIIGTIIMLILISIGSWYVTEALQNLDLKAASFRGLLAVLNWWPLDVTVLLTMFVLIYDADGLTPNLRSSLLAWSWNRGKMSVAERWGSSYSPTPYGKISVDLDKCTGCGTCVDVCPMLIPRLDEKNKKIILKRIRNCVNCRGCVNQCPTKALYLAPETEAAKKALECYLIMKSKKLVD